MRTIRRGSDFELEAPPRLAVMEAYESATIAVGPKSQYLVKGAHPYPNEISPAGAEVMGEGTGVLVESEPSNQRVEIDGVSRGRTPLRVALPPGRHTVVVSDGAGNQWGVARVSLTTREVPIMLRRDSAEVGGRGSVTDGKWRQGRGMGPLPGYRLETRRTPGFLGNFGALPGVGWQYRYTRAASPASAPRGRARTLPRPASPPKRGAVARPAEPGEESEPDGEDEYHIDERPAFGEVGYWTDLNRVHIALPRTGPNQWTEIGRRR